MTAQRPTPTTESPATLSTHRQLELFRDLQRLANARQEAETRIAETFRASSEAAEQSFKQQTAAIEKQNQATRDEAQQAHEAALATEAQQYSSLRDQTQSAYQQRRDEIHARYTETVESTKAERKQSTWQTLAVFDASKGTPKLRLEETNAQLAGLEQQIADFDAEAQQILNMRSLGSVANQSQTATPAEAEGMQVDAAIESVRAAVTALWEDGATRWLEGARPWLVGGALAAAPIIPLGFVLGWDNWIAYAVGVAIGAALAVVATRVLAKKARVAAVERWAAIRDAAFLARSAVTNAKESAVDVSRREAADLLATRDRDLAAAEESAKQRLAEIEEWKSQALDEATATFPGKLATMRSEHQQTTTAIEQTLRERTSEITQHRSDQSQAAFNAKKQALEGATKLRDSQWQQMHDEWQSGYAAVRDELAAMTDRCRELTPSWQSQSYADWTKPAEPTPAIPLGETTLNLAKVKSAVSSDRRLRPAEKELTVPALLHLTEQPTLVVTAPTAQRSKGTGVLQSALVRFLTAMPPGKVRLTLCDPVGLGESFSAFMHLADYDETLIAGRIWTQPRDIDEQLLRLSTHMETILQKYLRDEYESIHEYNAQAGEVAEPFQVLAIADFAHGISDTSMKRLLSLVKGGPRCGIYVLLSVDLAKRIAGDVPLESLTAGAVHLDWNAKANRFVWKYPAFEHLPLSLPDPLPADSLVPLLKQVGKAAQDAIKVEVPFDVVTPSGQLWQQTCDSELRVPIGRAGANRQQFVRLGKGTSQHLLVAGKTGSGKSTFLHALVTSAAMHFSPREVEFYLVDFKKGVEFKAYATEQLPHARVIAIESEREFGISVLERLDGILRERGEKFRAAGVQSLADYRAAHRDDPMPRILLVVDEFQELFVEDDKLASQASLLLDRLIRQGRAFGMHVVLGSQTLAGAYSLARATLGQMAVRVALQCSETDAHLILSDERNQAARFLSRPGEAIYNDQNGMASANEPFQVVWLPDSERSSYLGSIREQTTDAGVACPPPIVFEGNAPSTPSDNKQLVRLLGGETLDVPRIWLGAAVSIQPPTHVDFHRHAGSNMVIVGQNEPIALGVLTTATMSLSALPDARIDVIDGSRAGEPGEAAWKQLSETFGERLRIATARDAANVVAEAATEVARRESDGDETAPPRFVVIYNAARARDLRKGDDDFGFSFTKEESAPSVGKQFIELLKNGSTWGIHTLMWCDNYNALTRLMDRVTLREFDFRVVLQMAAGDSSNLIDTPAASRLTEFRALLYSDETGESEKFRPYETPNPDWLATLRDTQRVS